MRPTSVDVAIRFETNSQFNDNKYTIEHYKKRMGCTTSLMTTIKTSIKRRSSKVTIDTLETEMAESPNVRQRYGHPAYYRTDGYEVGLRFRV